MTTIILATIISVTSAITGLSAVWTMLTKPIKEIRNQYGNLEKRTVNHAEVLRVLMEDNKKELECFQTLIGHIREGNHSSEMKKLEENLDTYISRRGPLL